MEWVFIAVGAAFVTYLLYCCVKEWRDNRRFERIRRESRENAKVQRNESEVRRDDSLPIRKNRYRVEIVEEDGGWWSAQVWNADDEMVYQARRGSEDLARSHAVEMVLKQFDNSITPVTTTRYLRSE